MELLEAVRNAVQRHGLLQPDDSLVVGVSGGPDSLCLLHLLTRLKDELGLLLHVAHLNHLLRGEEAEGDAEFVREKAAEWDLPVTVRATDVAAMAAARRLGVEEAARQARYRFLTQVAGRVGATKIAVGHNSDDQAETVLMHLLRGAGLAGLRGMRPKMDLGEWVMWASEPGTGTEPAAPRPRLLVIRPLLEVTRSDIESYCQQHGLMPRFDRTNLDLTLHRNRLRHQVLPALERDFPGFRGRLRQLAELASADYALLESLLDERWREVLLSESDAAVALDLTAWRELPLSQRRGLLRRAVRRLRGSLRNLAFSHVEDARRVAETGETGAEATLPEGLRLRLSYEELLIASEGFVPPPPPAWPALGPRASPVPLAVPGRTRLPGTLWRVEVGLLPADRTTCAKAGTNRDRRQAFLDADVVGDAPVLRPRRPGERFQPIGMEGRSCSVADFMINRRIPAGWRDRIPILARPEHILWIVGWRLDQRARVTQGTRRVLWARFLGVDDSVR